MGATAQICAAQEEFWQKFMAPDNTCSALFPVAPTKQQSVKDSVAGKTVTNIWVAKDGEAIYLLGITDYPIDLNEQQEMDLDRDNFLKEVQAKLITESETTLRNHRGREFIGANTTYTFRSRVFVVGRRRVYQIVVGQPTANLDASTIDKFLASFALLDSIGHQ
ncbi:MAG TPA: hypothetical protein VKB46_20650 [Pyrinomonadaceae bacterium]|nr:hypothetical protein [Pyrinomonadaceae bacterium]